MRSFWCYCSASNRMWDMYPSISSVLPQQFPCRNPFRVFLIEWSPSGASPSSLHPPLPFQRAPSHRWIHALPTQKQQIVQLWKRMRLIKCAYLFIIIFCKRSYKFHPSVSTHLGPRAVIFGSTAKLERCSSFVLMFLEQELHWNENKKTIKIRNKLWCNRLKTFLR